MQPTSVALAFLGNGKGERRLRMRKNPVYVEQNCAKVVRSGALLTHHQTLRAHI